ncbi:MAG: putative surface layer protein, partial [Solirubrobacterales bacterium]|nr:putative surface layer protein [Solirubrobacterales bacterium]
AHTGAGAVSVLDGRPVRVRRVLRGFSAPRYAAIAPDGRHAFVTDSGAGELAVLDLRSARVVQRLSVGAHARHLTLDPAGRTLWIGLGSSATEVAVVDVRDPTQPRNVRRIRPPILAHDGGFTPSGRRVWVTAGRESRIAVYAADGHRAAALLAAAPGPQHVTFGPGAAYVASGSGRSLRVHALDDNRLLTDTRVPLGSYNVQRGAGRVLTPSLDMGQLTILDGRGRIVHEVQVASHAHDVCVV